MNRVNSGGPVSSLVQPEPGPRLYFRSRRWLFTRHALSAAVTVLTVMAAWAALTTPFMVFFALAFNDVSGYADVTVSVAAWASIMSAAIVLVALGLERLILQRSKGWIALALLVPVTAVTTLVLCCIALLLAIVAKSALVAEAAVLFLCSFAVYWSTLWVLNLASYVLRRVRFAPRQSSPPSSGRSTFARHALSVAATAVAPVAMLLAISLPFIALGAVLDRITPSENRIAFDWAGYLEVLLWAAVIGLALGILIAPIAWAFERKVLSGGAGWMSLSVSVPVAAPVIGMALLYIWFLTGHNSDVATWAVWTSVCTLLVFPAYWTSLWFWRLVPYGRRRFRQWRQRRSSPAIGPAQPSPAHDDAN
jgi:hypothetical protein